jgi:hypothetical protein
VSTRAFERLRFEHQRAVRAVAAKLARQGLKPLPVSECTANRNH